jgi:hypothetical protein
VTIAYRSFGSHALHPPGRPISLAEGEAERPAAWLAALSDAVPAALESPEHRRAGSTSARGSGSSAHCARTCSRRTDRAGRLLALLKRFLVDREMDDLKICCYRRRFSTRFRAHHRPHWPPKENRKPRDPHITACFARGAQVRDAPRPSPVPPSRTIRQTIGRASRCQRCPNETDLSRFHTAVC